MPADLKTKVMFGLFRGYGLVKQLFRTTQHAVLASKDYVQDASYYWYYAHWSGDLNSYLNSSLRPRTVSFLETLCAYLKETAATLRQGAVGTTRLANADIRESEALLFQQRLDDINTFTGDPQALLDLLMKALSQATELLEVYLEHTQMAANYIPVPPHLRSLDTLQSLYNACYRILHYSFGTGFRSPKTAPTVFSHRFLHTLTAMEILVLDHADTLSDNPDFQHLLNAHLTTVPSEDDQDGLDPVIHDRGIYNHFPKRAQVHAVEQTLASALQAAANETERKECLHTAAERLKTLYSVK